MSAFLIRPATEADLPGLQRLFHDLDSLHASLQHGSAIRIIDFSPDGSRALTAGADRLVRLWDARTGAAAAGAALAGHGGELTLARFSPDGLRVLTGAADRTSRIWDAASQQVTATLSEHTGVVQAGVLAVSCGTGFIRARMTANTTSSTIPIRAFTGLPC